MLICPYCKGDTEVKSHYARHNKAHDNVIRYRRCLKCGATFKTVERYDPDSSSHSGYRR